MKSFFLLIPAIIFSFSLFAQGQKHVVFLKNKDNNPYTLSNPSAFLTQQSLDRRTKSNISLDMKDLPVTPSYISQIAGTGADVVYSLKWFNAVVVSTNSPTVLAAIAALPFVDYIDQVLTDQPQNQGRVSGIKSTESIPPYTLMKAGPHAQVKSANILNYGQAYNQVHMISVDALHNLGFTGQGMMIAVLDAGFYHVDLISAFDSLWNNNRILGTRDFNLPGNNVFGDNMHTHGTSVLSTMGANLPGEMVGTAPHASYWLLRTEVGEYEALVEEYNWAGGAEFADSLGVDVINSSLGYTTFDNPSFNHTYADMNGNTAPSTRAGDLAASRGILVVNSALNEGGSPWQYIGAPADGDSVFSIGAVNSSGFYASFSSTGPTSDGRTKPDVTAQGQGATVVSGWGSVGQGSGTSFSSPIVAGALACLWQSTPAFSAEQIRNAVRSTASKATAPDSLYGWGIPNMLSAMTFLSTGVSEPIAQSQFTLFPMPFSTAPRLQNNLQVSASVNVEILSITGQTVGTKSFYFPGNTAMNLSEFNGLPSGIYFLRIYTGTSAQVIRAVKI
ncbi:MAG: S8 family serine peptidase [Bacteroidales bacterium]|nr:S8 family serine peptidase [Bacteroidales bacterium]